MRFHLFRAALGVLALAGTGAMAAPVAHALAVVHPPTASPGVIATGQATALTVTAQLSTAPGDPPFITSSVLLLRVSATDQPMAVLGKMHDDGLAGDATAGDGVYTLRLTVTEPAPGSFRLCVSAAQSRMLRRVFSAVTVVPVAAAAPTPTSSPTATPLPPTATVTLTPTRTPLPTATPTPIPTATPTGTPSSTPTRSPSPTAPPPPSATATQLLPDTPAASPSAPPTPASTLTPTATAGAALPPDPATVAPPLDRSVATRLHTAAAFLYTGNPPIQTGVAPNIIDPVRIAVLRGRVLQRGGAPLSGVVVTVLDHPEFGQTLSRTDGMYDLAVNGGGMLTVVFEKHGFLPAQRAEYAPWQDFGVLPDVILVPLDPAVTPVDLTAGGMQVARGSVVTDADGLRRQTVLFPAGTAAELVMPDGSTVPVSQLSVRMTEYTVGAEGPQAMPAELPPTSAYTYAVEFSADEALAVGATEVRFSQPVLGYVENFLDFPAGFPVPLGSYDRAAGKWIPADSGRVVRIVDIAGALAQVDTDGDGVADSGGSPAVTDAERQLLATLFTPGQTLWRFPIPHFSPWDCNWPFGPPPDAVPPPDEPVAGSPQTECEESDAGGGFYGYMIPVSQTVQNAVPRPGIGCSELHYDSSRVPDRRDAFGFDVPLSRSTIPSSVKRIELEIEIAGQRFTQSLPAAPDQTTSFTWDGRDAYGRVLQGVQTANVTVGYSYDGSYARTTRFANRPDSFVISGDVTRQEVTLSRSRRIDVGLFDAAGVGLGGWTVENHHSYDPGGHVLSFGEGGERRDIGFGGEIRTLAGKLTQGFSGDGGPAIDAELLDPAGIDVAADGSLYFTDSQNTRVRRIGRDGTISTVAGTGTYDNGGDGGLATLANIKADRVRVAADGSLYIGSTDASTSAALVRRVAQDGTISTVAGTDPPGVAGEDVAALSVHFDGANPVPAPDGSLYVAERTRVRRIGTDGLVRTIAGGGVDAVTDGILGTDASIGEIRDIALGPDGSVYISETTPGPLNTFQRVRRIGVDGRVTTIAGNGANQVGEGIPAIAAQVAPYALTVARDGTVYFFDPFSARIKTISSAGILTTFAGTGLADLSGDGGLATQTHLGFMRGIALGPDGRVFVSEDALQNPESGGSPVSRVRQIAPALPSFSNAPITVASHEGAALYQFDTVGRHLRTLNALTGATLRTFTYDAAGHLDQITDADGNVTTIERDGTGEPTAVRCPRGQVQSMATDANGRIASVTNAAHETHQFSYTSGGLMTRHVTPRGSTFDFTYDAQGRAIRRDDPDLAFRTLTRTNQIGGFTVASTTGLGRTTTYEIQRPTSGDVKRIATKPDGLTVERVTGRAGTDSFATANGMRGSEKFGPDPRFGMQSPITAEDTIGSPGGVSLWDSGSRSVSLAVPGDPLSLTTMTDTRSVNGLLHTSTYEATTRAFTLTSPSGRLARTQIDAIGRIIQTQEGGLLPLDIGYDVSGRVATITRGGGAQARTVTTTYHPEGYLASLTDPLGRSEQYAYDAAGRLLQQTLRDGRVVGSTYDADGNRLSVTPPGRPAHVFGYNAMRQLVSYTPPDVGIGSTSTLYSYDADRQLEQITRPDGSTVTYSYDAAGRLASMTLPSGSYTITYGPTGDIDTFAAPGGSALAYSYDGALTTSETWAGPVAGSVGYVYDAFFRLRSETVDGGHGVTFTFDDDSLVTSVGALSFTRDPQHGSVSEVSIGAVSESIGYDTFGEVSSHTVTAAGTGVYAVTYAYDPLGRIATKTETVQGVTTSHAYTYDNAGRLTDVQHDGLNVASYTYDANDNRLTGPGLGSPPTYDAQDRLLAFGNATYTHTAAGERLTRTVGGQTTTYVRDAFGDLRSVALPDGTLIEYVLDGRGRRLGRKVNGALAQGFLYRGDLAIVAEVDGAGNVVSRFVYSADGNVAEYMVRGGATYRLVVDQVGSPRLVVDVATGAVVQRMDYDEWGNVIADTNPGFQPFGFAGGLYDAATGLTHFGARDYDAATGRWTVRDPILFKGGATNLYAYAGSDPINLRDPVGLQMVQNTGGNRVYGRTTSDGQIIFTAPQSGQQGYYQSSSSQPIVTTSQGWGTQTGTRSQSHQGMTPIYSPDGRPTYRGDGVLNGVSGPSGSKNMGPIIPGTVPGSSGSNRCTEDKRKKKQPNEGNQQRDMTHQNSNVPQNAADLGNRLHSGLNSGNALRGGAGALP